MTVCTVDGCDLQPVARGWCHPHWHRWRRYGDPTYVPPPLAPADVRFWAKVDKSGGEDACWPRKGAHEFALSRGNSRPVTACAWILTHGGLPVDKRAIHTCGSREQACVNPRHLMIGTLGDMVRRVSDHPNKGGRKGAKHAQLKARCKQGHVFTEATTMLRPDGYRRCRVCHNAGQNRRRARYTNRPVSSLVSRLLADLKEEA